MRLKKHPDILYGCWNKTNKSVLVLFNKDIADNLIKIGEDVIIYDRRIPKPALIPAVVPKEPDNAPQTPTEALPTATKTMSEAELDTASKQSKKRHRRTKAEIEARNACIEADNQAGSLG